MIKFRTQCYNRGRSPTMKVRSPVLGYNHNVRYAGRLWHVQTEDSGVQNPHIFTHLFHDGTILATKRHDYDPASDVTAVQKIMQVQHKAMLRELKAGAFDEKIGKFFGTPVARDEEEQPAPTARPPLNDDATIEAAEAALTPTASEAAVARGSSGSMRGPRTDLVPPPAGRA